MCESWNITLSIISQFDENIRLMIRRYDDVSSEPEKSPSRDGQSLKPETPEPDGDSNQERAKERGVKQEYQSIVLNRREKMWTLK